MITVSSRPWTVYRAVLWIALLWAVFNCLHVYLALEGRQSFRIESAVFLLVVALSPLIVWRQPQGPPPTSLLTLTHTRLMLWISIGLWLIAMVPLLAFPYLSDDFVFLDLYAHWSDISRSPRFFRPMFAAVFLMLTTIGQGSPASFHVASLVIHATSSALVYVLAHRLFRRRDGATVCFVMFLLNPLQLEAALWISGLQELLWTAFVLSALALYTGSQLLTIRRLLGTLALVILALLSKETAVDYMLLLPGADWIYFRMKRGPHLATGYALFTLTLAAYVVARRQFASIDEAAFFERPTMYFAKQFLVIPYKYFVQPWNVSAIDVPAVALCVVSVVAIGLAFRAALRGAGARALVGPAVILASTLPLYTFFYVAPNLAGARYLYFGALGFGILTAEALLSATRSARTLAGAVMIIAAVWFVSLEINLKSWRTAGQIVRSVESGLRQGRSLDSVLADWQQELGTDLELRNGIPYEYEGVGVFVNGYPEFRKRLASQNGPGANR